MDTVDVGIILGSGNDRKYLDESEALMILQKLGIRWELSYISAHRNPRELEHYVRGAVSRGAVLFIGAAGMSAQLPGEIASRLVADGTIRPVIGVPLPSTSFPNAMDALLAMIQMPPGMPVSVCGLGVIGFKNAALAAAQVVAAVSSEVEVALAVWLAENTKQPQIAVETSETYMSPTKT